MDNTNSAWVGAATQAAVDPLVKIREDFLALPPEKQIEVRDKALLKWQDEQKMLTAAKEAEAATRIAIVAMLFDPKKDEGTQTIELGNGWKIKAAKKLNYTVGNGRENPSYSDVDAALDTISGLEFDGASMLADRLVSWKPELSLSEYRRVTDEFPSVKAIIDRVITTKPGMPTVELIPPSLPGMPRGKRK